jgi:hypothetical protein
MISPPEKLPDQFMAVAVIRPTIAAGRLAFMDLQLGMACYRKLPPQRPIIPEPESRIIGRLRRRQCACSTHAGSSLALMTAVP